MKRSHSSSSPSRGASWDNRIINTKNLKEYNAEDDPNNPFTRTDKVSLTSPGPYMAIESNL